MEIEEHVAPGHDEFDISVEVERERAPQPIDVEDGRQPRIFAHMLAMERGERADGHHALFLEHEYLEDRRALMRDDRRDEHDDVEPRQAHGKPLERAQHVMHEVLGFNERTRQSPGDERRGHAQKTGALLASDCRLAFYASANCLDISQAHVDLRDRDLHKPPLPSSCTTCQHAEQGRAHRRRLRFYAKRGRRAATPRPLIAPPSNDRETPRCQRVFSTQPI